MPQRTRLSFQGLDRASPADRADPGACRVLDGAVAPEGRRGWVPAARPSGTAVTLDDTQVSGFEITASFSTPPQGGLSLAEQVQDRGSRVLFLRKGSDAQNTSNDRLLAADPSSGLAETALTELDGADDTREIQADTITKDTVVGVTSGSGVGTPESLLLLRGDSVTKMPWPKPPTFSVSWSERTGENFVPQGTYVVRLAWRLEDGTVGPASGPYVTTTPDPSGDNGFEAKITIEGYPSGQPSSAWTDRIAGLTVIVHPEATTDAAAVEALDVPGYRVTGWEGVPSQSDTTTWADSLEGIISGTAHEEHTLVHHNLSAGAVFSYNKRLILGDTEYDLEAPLLDHMIKGGGTGTDYHLTMRVRVQTSQGVITRYSAPIGFAASDATNVEVRGGIIYYRDGRALTWKWLVAQDYTGSNFDSATWEEASVQGTPNELQEAASSNFAYVTLPSQYVDLTARTFSDVDVTGNANWTDDLKSEETESDTPRGSTSSSDTPHDAKLDLVGNNVISSSENLTQARFTVTLSVTEDERGAGRASASADITVSVLDANGNTLDQATRSIDTVQGTTEVIVLDGFQPANAEQLRVETEASASANASGDDSATASGAASAGPVEIEVADESGGSTVSVDRSAAHAETDRDPNRLVWSEPLRPLDLRAENVEYAGGDDRDSILGLASNAAEVSEGQYGDYPLLVLGRRSIRALSVGTDPFIVSSEVIAPDFGMVGRGAYCNANGPVLVATERGVAELTPTLQGYVSSPLHDPGGTFLGSLGAGTELAFYTDRQAGRREVWVCTNDKTYVRSSGGAWSTLAQPRQDSARLGASLYGLDDDGTLRVEGVGEGGNTVTIRTAPSGLGAPSSVKRVRDAWVIMGHPPDPGQETYFLLLSHHETTQGIDYTTDLRAAMRLDRGLAQAFSTYLKAACRPDVTLIGVGLQHETRRPGRPLASLQLDEAQLGPAATKADLDAEVSW